MAGKLLRRKMEKKAKKSYASAEKSRFVEMRKNHQPKRQALYRMVQM